MAGRGARVDAEWAADPAVGRRARGARVASAAVLTRKAIADNCSQMSSASLDVIIKDGLTLRQRVHRDKQAKLEGENIKFGKKYWEALRALYADTTTVEGSLHMLPGSEVNPQLYRCLAQALKWPPNRGPLVQHLGMVTAMSRGDVVAVLKYLCRLNAASSEDQCLCAVTIVQTLGRVGAQVENAEHIAIAKPKIDEVLTQALSCTLPT